MQRKRSTPSGQAAEPAGPEPDEAPMRVRRSELPDGRELFLYDFGGDRAEPSARAADAPAGRPEDPER